MQLPHFASQPKKAVILMPSEGSPLLSIFCLDKLSTAGLVHQVRAAIFAANLGSPLTTNPRPIATYESRLLGVGIIQTRKPTSSHFGKRWLLSSYRHVDFLWQVHPAPRYTFSRGRDTCTWPSPHLPCGPRSVFDNPQARRSSS